jgi:hypothetical protein
MKLLRIVLLARKSNRRSPDFAGKALEFSQLKAMNWSLRAEKSGSPSGGFSNFGK